MEARVETFLLNCYEHLPCWLSSRSAAGEGGSEAAAGPFCCTSTAYVLGMRNAGNVSSLQLQRPKRVSTYSRTHETRALKGLKEAVQRSVVREKQEALRVKV